MFRTVIELGCAASGSRHLAGMAIATRAKIKMKYRITIHAENNVNRRQMNKSAEEIAEDVKNAWDRLVEVLNEESENATKYEVVDVRIMG